MSLTLKNPEKFGLNFAAISEHRVSWQTIHYSDDDYWINSERGGKQIFSREKGKGAIWQEAVLPEST